MKRENNLYLVSKELDFYKKRYVFLFVTFVGFALLFFGSSMNATVFLDNGGMMPVYTDRITTSPKHFTYQNPSEVKHHYLADIHKFSLGKDTIIFYSIGDFLVIFGGLVMIFGGVMEFIYYIKLKKLYKSPT